MTNRIRIYCVQIKSLRNRQNINIYQVKKIDFTKYKNINQNDSINNFLIAKNNFSTFICIR